MANPEIGPRRPAAAVAAPHPAEWLAKNTFLLAAERVPTRLLEYDTVYSGGKGTGKTTVLIMQMLSVFMAWLAAGRPFNAHAYTPKPLDFYPLLKQLFEPLGISVRATNPFLRDAWAWDGAMDLTTPPAIDTLATSLIRDDGRDQNPFFKKSAQLALRGVIQSLAATHPRVFTMRHVASVMKEMPALMRVLDRYEHTRHIASLIAEKQGLTAANVHMTLLAELKGLDLVAALIDETPDDRRYSLAAAANAPGVITVWGSDPRYDTTIEPWNGIQWELMGNELLIRGDIGVDTFFFVDEFTQLNGGVKLPIVRKVLEYGRSSRVRSTLAVQTPGQVDAVYGPSEADTLLGQAHNAVIFRHSDLKGQDYWSRRLGRARGIEPKWSVARQCGGGPRGLVSNWSESETVSFDRFDRERVTPSDINDLPVGSFEHGIYGYAMLPLSRHLNPETGIPEPIKWLFGLSPRWLRANAPPKAACEPYMRLLKDEASYTLRPLEGWEYEFLGLDRPA